MKKRIVSILLATCMLLCMLPVMSTTEAYVDPDVEYPVTGGNIYFDKSTGTVTGCDDTVTAADIPAEIEGVAVTAILAEAFLDCSSLASVSLPSNIMKIGADAFLGTAYYSNEASWENGVLYIGSALIKAREELSGAYTIKSGTSCIADKAFARCSNLTELNVPGSITRIESFAFWNCYALKSLSISEGVIYIGRNAFGVCDGLASVTLPKSVKSIDRSAFFQCKTLTDIYYSGTEDDWKGIDIETGNDPLLNADIWYNSTGPEIVAYTVTDGNIYFDKLSGKITGCDDTVTEANIPAEIEGLPVTAIGAEAFQNCSSLERVSFPRSLTSIGHKAFYRCESLTGVSFPSGLTSIGDRAFYVNRKLKSISIPSSVTSIGSEAFNVCSQLEGISVSPENLCYSSVDGVLFNKNQTELITYPVGRSGRSYSIPNGVTDLADHAFWNCWLESVNIPSSVTAIGDSVFGACTNLRSISIPGSVTVIGNGAFRYCNRLTSVSIPSSVTSIDISAFYDCGSLTDIYFSGTAEEWQRIDIYDDNEPLLNANIHYGYALKLGTDSPDVIKLLRYEGMEQGATGEPIEYGYDPTKKDIVLAAADTATVNAAMMPLRSARLERFTRDGVEALSVLTDEESGVLTVQDGSRAYLRVTAEEGANGGVQLCFTSLAPAAIRLTLGGREYLIVTPGDVNLDGEMDANDWANIMRWTLEAASRFDATPKEPCYTVSINGAQHNIWLLSADMNDNKAADTSNEEDWSDVVDANDWSTMMYLTLEAWKR